MCARHYQGAKRRGAFEGVPRAKPFRPGPNIAICSVEGCTKTQKAKGLCKTHYNKSPHTRTERVSRHGLCLTDGCIEHRIARGLCQKHYNVWNAPKAKLQTTAAYELRKYGLTPQNKEALFTSQKGKCAICPRDIGVKGQRGDHIDHCHVTGQVRGILCLKCNLMLGYADDDIMVLENAITYLADPPAKKVLL